jgi:hypothetical protein
MISILNDDDIKYSFIRDYIRNHNSLILSDIFDPYPFLSKVRSDTKNHESQKNKIRDSEYTIGRLHCAVLYQKISIVNGRLFTKKKPD